MTGKDDQSPLRAKVIELAPRRLRVGEGAAAEAARAFAAETDVPARDEEGWQRLTIRLFEPQRGPQVWRLGMAAAFGVAVVVVLLLRSGTLSKNSSHDSNARPAIEAPALGHAAAAAGTALSGPPPGAAQPSGPGQSSGARVRLSAAPRRLHAGDLDLNGEARVVLSAGARAIASADAGNTRITLLRGSIHLDVLPRPPGHRLQVAMGPYRFVVVGTSFRVARIGERVELMVFEGRVGVWRAKQPRTVVAAGGRWTGALSPAPSVATSSLGSARLKSRTAEIVARCEAAAGGGRLQEALDCYQHLADGSDLDAELALYEVARLELQVTGDVEDALETLAEHRRRFPQSVLRPEVDLTRVELLPRLGDHKRALKESERILRAHPDHERRRELRLLRGNIFREALGDCARAEPEYREAASDGGKERTADDAAFYRAICLELQGTPSEAIAALQAYLERAQPRHEAEARKRLSALRP